MECRICGRLAPPDRETGYNGDDVCPRPACQDAAWEQAGEADLDDAEEACERQREILESPVWRNS